jgi:predicted secreted Zn-dependent protease
MIIIHSPIRRMWFFALYFVCAVSACPVSAYASPQVSVSEKFYTVRGGTAQELRQQLDRHGVRTDGGKTYDAYTSWHVYWRYHLAPRGNACTVENIRVSVTVVYTLPEWRGMGKAPQDLRNRWRQYMKDLKTHEDGHRDYGIAAAADIERALHSIRPEANCRIMEKKVNEAGHAILDQYRSKERLYDLRTFHGRTQGARFP